MNESNGKLKLMAGAAISVFILFSAFLVSGADDKAADKAVKKGTSESDKDSAVKKKSDDVIVGTKDRPVVIPRDLLENKAAEDGKSKSAEDYKKSSISKEEAYKLDQERLRKKYELQKKKIMEEKKKNSESSR